MGSVQHAEVQTSFRVTFYVHLPFFCLYLWYFMVPRTMFADRCLTDMREISRRVTKNVMNVFEK